MRKHVLQTLIILLLCMLPIGYLTQSVSALGPEWELTDKVTLDGEAIYVRDTFLEEDVWGEEYCTADGTKVESFYERDVYGNQVENYKRVDRPLPTYHVKLVTTMPVATEDYFQGASGTKMKVPDCSFDVKEGYRFKCWRLEGIHTSDLFFFYPGDTLTIPNQDVVLLAVIVSTTAPEQSGGPDLPELPIDPESPDPRPEHKDPEPETDGRFHDVKPDDWFYKDVQFVCGEKLMNGVGNGLFQPMGLTNRAMIVTILYRMAGEPAVTGDNPFTDVAKGSWYTDAVIWTASEGIVSGYGNGLYGSSDPITREQLAAILYRFAKAQQMDTFAVGDLTVYDDANQISTWAKDAMTWANGAGLVNGRTAQSIAPKATATRAELAAILHRFCEQ